MLGTCLTCRQLCVFHRDCGESPSLYLRHSELITHTVSHCFRAVKNGLNEFPWFCPHTTLKYVEKIKGTAEKNGDFNSTCK